MAALPVVCNFEDGCILTMVSVDTEDTMDQVADKVAVHFVGRMLRPKPGRVMRVRLQGEGTFFERTARVAQVGWTPLTTIEIAYE
jgi:toluene monooxygenase system protein B